MAHMCGFAAITSGSAMQQLPVFRASPVMSLLPLLINQTFIVIQFSIFKKLREWQQSAAKAAGKQGVRARMFNEEVMESENDISCLGGSYLLTQSIRYFQVGKLPTKTGEMP